MKLLAGRWQNTYTAPTLLETFSSQANVGIRWSLPGGVKRIEVTVKTRGKFDAFDRYKSHHGQRLAVYDSLFGRPIADGHIYEIVPDGGYVHYIADGPWKEHYRDKDTGGYASGTTVANIIKSTLTNHVTIVGSDQSNIDSTGTTRGTTWDVDPNGGSFPGDMIEDFLLMSDTAGNVWDYWLIPAPFAGASLGKPIAYLKARGENGAANWQFKRRDIQAGGFQQSRHIWDLVRDMRTYYGSTPTAGTTYTSTQTDLWTVDRVTTQSQFNVTQANQYSQMILAMFEKPVQQQSFTISGPFIRDASGNKWPLWEVVKRGRAYMRMADFYPQAETLGKTIDRTQTFCIVAMDYDYISNVLRITPDSPDARLDVLLARSGVEEAKGEMVDRARPVLSANDMVASINTDRQKFKRGNMRRPGGRLGGGITNW